MGEQEPLVPLQGEKKEILVFILTVLVIISMVSSSIFFLSNNNSDEEINSIFNMGDPLLQGEGHDHRNASQTTQK